MGSHPQTLYGIEDSPIGLAAWFCDHDLKSYELKARVFEGKAEGLTRDDILDNITLAWLTKTAIASARLYWENKLPFFQPIGVNIPIAISAFPDELYQAPKSWVERPYPKLIHYNRLPKGGHFAAWEQPQFLTPRDARRLQSRFAIDLRRRRACRCGPAMSSTNRDGAYHVWRHRRRDEHCHDGSRGRDQLMPHDRRRAGDKVPPFKVSVHDDAPRICGGASRRRTGRSGKQSRIRRRAYSWRRFRELARYWATEHDWRKVGGAARTPMPQFVTEIDGLDIHFDPRASSKHERCVAAHCHAWMAGLGRRAAQDDRSTYQSHRERWECIDAFRRPSHSSMAGYGFR